MDNQVKEQFIIEEDSKVIVLESKEDVQKIKDSIQGVDNTNVEDNVVYLPTKYPLKLVAALIANIIVFVIIGTTTYVRLSTKLDTHEAQLSEVSKRIYTKEQAEQNVRIEIQNLEQRMLNFRLEEMKEALRKGRE